MRRYSLLSLLVAPAVFALFVLVAPLVAAAQDVQPLVDGVVATWPAVAPYLALVPIVQVVAAAGERLSRRKHSTWLNTAFRWVAALPIRPPTLPAK
jgi:hypothetical protein